MKTLMLLAASALLAPPAPAQEAGPAPAAKEEEAPRHQNKVTEAARAALDRLAALVYTPLKGGLKDCIARINQSGITTVGACGDIVRNVMAPAAPMSSAVSGLPSRS